MKVNCISYENIKHIQTDIEAIRFLFKKSKDKLDFSAVNGHHYKCPAASINLFINMINPCLFRYAKINLVIIDPSEFPTSMLHTLKDVDGILVKTKYAYDVIHSECNNLGIFTKEELNKKLHLVYWRSPNLKTNVKKDFDRVLLFCDNRESQVYMDIVKIWKPEYPLLCVVNGNANRFCAGRDRTKEYSKVEFFDTIQNDQFHKLFNQCAFHLCVDNSSSFDHMANQAKLVGSIPIGCKSGGRAELLNKDCAFILGGKRKKNKTKTLGGLFTTTLSTLTEVMEEITNTSEASFEYMRKASHTDAMRYQKETDEKFLPVLKKYVLLARNMKKTIRDELVEEDLPSISIITPTYNRKKIFPLAIYNYNSLNYPRDKLEWIIIDDSVEEQSVESQLPPEDQREKYNIKYIRLTEKQSITEKRTIGIKQAKNDFILLLDDDDYLYPDTLKMRLKEYTNIKRDKPYKKFMGFTKLGCFDIERYVSWIHIPDSKDQLYENVVGSSLLFERDFYTNDNEFDKTNECNGFANFFKNREHMFVEQSWENNFVSLSHKDCVNGKHTPDKQDANGCHFGFSKKLFEFIVELFKEPKSTTTTESVSPEKTVVEENNVETNTTEEETIQDNIEYEIVEAPQEV